MEIKQTLNGKDLTISLEGSLDTTTAPELKKTLDGTMENIDSLTLDFDKLEYVSSVGLRVMLQAHNIMAKKGGMKIIQVNEEIVDTLEITGLLDMLNVEKKA